MDQSGARLLRDLKAGRGSCEIWSLQLGDLVRGQVSPGMENPPIWSASINATDLGRHSSRDAAIHRVETAIKAQMGPTLGDWIKFQADPKRPTR
jgi:hypothetical protein